VDAIVRTEKNQMPTSCQQSTIKDMVRSIQLDSQIGNMWEESSSPKKQVSCGQLITIIGFVETLHESLTC
jgi:hypothetical protein